MADPYIKQYLMTAGPTPLPAAVSQAMAEPMLYHRAPAFIELYARCLDGLKRVFGTENEVLCFAASGSGAMESAVANLTRPGRERQYDAGDAEDPAGRCQSSVAPRLARLHLLAPVARHDDPGDREREGQVERDAGEGEEDEQGRHR